jgi:histidyl-tRNA synthetase
MTIQKCKGTKDLLPEEMTRFRQIEGIFRDTCDKWGYKEIRTPTIEYLHLFTSTGTLTPGTLSKVYSFLDWDGWSGERVVMRPDGTIPVARSYIECLTPEKLTRLYYVTNIFIFEETGKERRERWQCGAELIGADSTSADIELISIALETLQRIGIKDIELKLSHAGIIRSLLAGFGLSTEEQGQVFDQILDGDTSVLNQLKTRTPELMRVLSPLLDLKGKSSGFLKNLRAVASSNLPYIAPALDNFIAISDILTSMGLNYEIDIASGRGFEYYTGLIFQLFTEKIKVGGGGRYNALIPLLGGDNIPASGFALYLDPLMELILPKRTAGDKVLVTIINRKPKLVSAALRAIDELHKAGFYANLDLDMTEKRDYKWRLELRDKEPRFTLRSKSSKKAQEAATIDTVLKLLGGKRAR